MTKGRAGFATESDWPCSNPKNLKIRVVQIVQDVELNLIFNVNSNATMYTQRSVFVNKVVTRNVEVREASGIVQIRNQFDYSLQKG